VVILFTDVVETNHMRRNPQKNITASLCHGIAEGKDLPNATPEV